METQLEVRAHMTRYPLTMTRGMRAARALELMRENSIRHLPVVDGDRIVGIVSERDLGGPKLMETTMTADHLSVRSFMTPDPFVARLDTRLSEVTAAMANQKFGSAVILNASNEVSGIFTTTDAMHLLTRLLRERETAKAEVCELEDGFASYMHEWIKWDSPMLG